MKGILSLAVVIFVFGQTLAHVKRNADEDQCEPEAVCHQCVTGKFPADLCCRDVQTYYKLNLANPEDCSSYYTCVNDHAILRQCPDGLHWSIETDRCEWPQIAQCEAGNGGGNNGGGNNGGGEGGEGGNNGGGEGGEGGEGGNNGGGEGGEGGEGGNNGGGEGGEGGEGGNNGGGEGGNNGGGEGGNNGGGEGGNNGGGEGGNNGGVSQDCLSGKADAATCCKDVPADVDVLLQNNANCHTFIQCVHGKPMVRDCPSKLWWSITANRCEWKEKATCTWEN